MKFIVLFSILALACTVTATPLPHTLKLNRPQRFITGFFDSSKETVSKKENALLHPVHAVKQAVEDLKKFLHNPAKPIGNSINVVKQRFKEDFWRGLGRLTKDAALVAVPGALLGKALVKSASE
jgi:hypothetical protein